MTIYNPNEVGKKGTIFGYPYSIEDADLVLIPVPWDVTVSFGGGTSKAPKLIQNESTQLDFSLSNIQKAYTYPLAITSLDEKLRRASSHYRVKAEKLMLALEEYGVLTDPEKSIQSEINQGCIEMVASVKKKAIKYLHDGKIVGLVGGDHSTPLGLMQALGEIHDDYGILQIDAHMDLRYWYEGFEHSHASIMKNALDVTSVSRLVQVGIRDYCQEEEELAEELDSRVYVHYDEVLQYERWKGMNWPTQVARIITNLPDKVYISFDMDGLDQSLCPKTGTPVPGGLSFYEGIFLIEAVVHSGRELIGFDVSETGNHPWDANVAARILFRMSTCVGVSRGRLAFS